MPKTEIKKLLDLLNSAQKDLLSCITKLEIYVKETKDEDTTFYLIDPLKIFATNKHGFLTDDLNIDKLKRKVKTGEFLEDKED